MGVSPAGNKRLFLFILGLMILYRYRKELKNYRDVFPLLTLGFLFMFSIEAGFKILAEGVFLSVFYSCLSIARRLWPEPCK